MSCVFFFFNDTATTEIYTLSLHDALPISNVSGRCEAAPRGATRSVTAFFRRHRAFVVLVGLAVLVTRSEEHTSELQSRLHLVCRLLLEKKKKTMPRTTALSRQTRRARAVA